MKKTLFTSGLSMLVLLNAHAQTKKSTPNTKTATKVKTTAATVPALKNATDSFSYALGMNIGTSLKMQSINEINEAALRQALDNVLHNKPTVLTEEQANMTLQQRLRELADKKISAEKEKGAAFLAANGKRAGVITLPDGIQYEVLKKGEDTSNVTPKVTDTISANYVGTLIDGKEFDNSYKRNAPITIAVNGVIKGWTEILQKMHKGDKWRVYIPSDMAYGDRGAGGMIPGGATLIFEIELVDINPAAK